MKFAYLEELSKMRIGEMEKPAAGPGQVLIKLAACGICGSDVHLYSHGKSGKFVVEYPFILGHECAGTVVAVGEGVSHLKEGDRVAMEPTVPCGECPQCRAGRYNLCPDVKCLAAPPVQGCLQEYVAYDARFAFKLPDGMTMEEGAMLEPLAVALHTCKLGGITIGDTVVITGAGCIGIMCLLVAKSMGAGQIFISDVVEPRLALAKELGGTPIHSGKDDLVAAVMQATGGLGANVVVDAAGFTSTMNQNLLAVAPGGTVVQVGLGEDVFREINIAPLLQKQVTYRGVFRYANDYPAAIRAVSSGRIDLSKVVSHRYAFEDSPRAFAEAVSKRNEITKGMIVF